MVVKAVLAIVGNTGGRTVEPGWEGGALNYPGVISS